ncbi:hypothetical protein [Rhizobium sp. NRK18]|uniref:hypothetical protein n=1 Tax=Rhizobium sp. NRK18 TaxID=2964667 RepID=UPI0021C27794|nr:hypothetical protein [Rhizobium sp. NRK18]MCQ2004337.1 hypothetical protein [Rhizobium sp. NRK18]
MGLIIWGVVFGALVLLAIVATRMAKQDDEDGLHDTGIAIMEFGRAYPDEAIRALHSTADGNAVFVRLHDDKAGFMRSLKNHFACHLIQPGRVRAGEGAAKNSLKVEFLDAPYHNGTYQFKSAKEASEVSLWLLGNLLKDSDKKAS